MNGDCNTNEKSIKAQFRKVIESVYSKYIVNSQNTHYTRCKNTKKPRKPVLGELIFKCNDVKDLNS